MVKHTQTYVSSPRPKDYLSRLKQVRLPIGAASQGLDSSGQAGE
jgi:hypothetical protein